MLAASVLRTVDPCKRAVDRQAIGQEKHLLFGVGDGHESASYRKGSRPFSWAVHNRRIDAVVPEALQVAHLDIHSSKSLGFRASPARFASAPFKLLVD